MRESNVAMVFSEALDRIKPFFETGSAWGAGAMPYWAYRTLRDQFPDLTNSEVRLIVETARRSSSGGG